MNYKSEYKGTEVFEGMKHAKLIKQDGARLAAYYINAQGNIIRLDTVTREERVSEKAAQFFLEGTFEMYEHLDQRLTKGNIVRIVSTSDISPSFHVGDIVKIIEDDKSPCPYRVRVLKGNKPENTGWMFPWNFEKLSNEEMKEFERAEIGEYVVVTGGDNLILSEGDVAQVREVTPTGYNLAKMNGKDGGFKFEENVRKATGEEVKQAKRYAYEVGDVVVVLKGHNGYAKEGDVVEISHEATGLSLMKTKSIITGRYMGKKKAENIRLATTEEIEDYKKKQVDEKLRLKWEAIGREIGEFKTGDIVRVTNEKGESNPNGYIGTVTKFDPNLRNTSETKEHRLAEVDTGRGISIHAIVELVVPVEKRFDAKG